MYERPETRGAWLESRRLGSYALHQAYRITAPGTNQKKTLILGGRSSASKCFRNIKSSKHFRVQDQFAAVLGEASLAENSTGLISLGLMELIFHDPRLHRYKSCCGFRGCCLQRHILTASSSSSRLFKQQIHCLLNAIKIWSHVAWISLVGCVELSPSFPPSMCEQMQETSPEPLNTPSIALLSIFLEQRQSPAQSLIRPGQCSPTCPEPHCLVAP
jgi:hypothetical protein